MRNEDIMSCYPENCPPLDAKPYKGKIFRFVKHNPVSQKDCLTAIESGLHPDADLCTRHALSCGISEAYLDKMLSLVPIFRNKKRAFAEIDYNDGVIKQTGDNLTHYSSWAQCELQNILYKKFEVIES